MLRLVAAGHGHGYCATHQLLQFKRHETCRWRSSGPTAVECMACLLLFTSSLLVAVLMMLRCRLT
jgi:hypothetical protein